MVAVCEQARIKTAFNGHKPQAEPATSGWVGRGMDVMKSASVVCK